MTVPGTEVGLKTTEPLIKYWRDAFIRLDAPIPGSGVFYPLIQRYREPHRHYHTVNHLEECFAWFDQLVEVLNEPGEISLALFYHDAIYAPTESDNEIKSAELARITLPGLGITTLAIDSIETMISATAHIGGADLPSDAQYLVDIDLSILGSAPARFDEYEAQIREEYRAYPDNQYKAGRSEFLRKMLARESIFNTNYFRGLLEGRARENIRRSMMTMQ